MVSFWCDFQTLPYGMRTPVLPKGGAGVFLLPWLKSSGKIIKNPYAKKFSALSKERERKH